jgi:hypothetical protein
MPDRESFFVESTRTLASCILNSQHISVPLVEPFDGTSRSTCVHVRICLLPVLEVEDCGEIVKTEVTWGTAVTGKGCAAEFDSLYKGMRGKSRRR